MHLCTSVYKLRSVNIRFVCMCVQLSTCQHEKPADCDCDILYGRYPAHRKTQRLRQVAQLSFILKVLSSLSNFVKWVICLNICWSCFLLAGICPCKS